MLTIDGSFGEGGGQILRSALALSMLTGTPFRIENLRAKRRKPGLMRQHLTAVRAATVVSGATVSGDAIGSSTLEFAPGKVRGGDYTFSVGTAGSATLVLQTVLPALVVGSEPSRLVLEGGTHNPMAPPFEFLAKAYVPIVRRMGPGIEIALEKAGFFPAGGGRFTTSIEPVDRLAGIELRKRGALVRRSGHAIVANLPRRIAEREIGVLQRKLGWTPKEFSASEVSDSPGPGNIVIVEIESEHVCEVISGFGEVNCPAEKVAGFVVQRCKRYLSTSAPVGEFLTDQLILPMAIAGTGSFVSTGLSRHAWTHIELVKRFLDRELITEQFPDGVSVTVR